VRNLITELKDIEKGEIKSASVKLDEVSVEKFIKLVQLNVPSHKLALETDNGKLYMLNEITIAKLVKGLAYESELNDEELNYMKTMDLSSMTKNLKLKIIESRADIPDKRYSYKKNMDEPPIKKRITTKTRIQGSFFKYLNNTQFDFSEFGIFKEINKKNYNDNCLYLAL